MKTTLFKKIAGFALSVWAAAGFAQCPTMNGIYALQGTGTATVAAMMTPSTSIGSGSFYWTVSPSTAYFSPGAGNSFQQYLSFGSTGTYTVCANYVDSLSGCAASSCTVLTVTSTGTAGCNASFTQYTDSSCMTHFINSSTGSNLSYRWYRLPSYTLLSTQANPVLNLGNGGQHIVLFTYSNNQFCDSTTTFFFVGCNTGLGSCSATFTSYTDSNCVTHFVNTGTVTGTPSYVWEVNGNTYTSNHLNLSLANGSYYVSHYTYSNNMLCDSVSQLVTVACGTTSTSCQANSQFTVFADSVNAGNYFAYNQSTGSGMLSYLWDFGDGTTSTQQYPFHQYATPGQYIICLTVTAGNGSVTCTDISCDSSSVHRISAAYLMKSFRVLSQAPTAVSENSLLKSLSVYPNPVDNELTVDLQVSNDQQLEYLITDALGKVVDRNTLQAGKTVINTGNLDRGIYFFTISSGGKILKTARLVK